MTDPSEGRNVDVEVDIGNEPQIDFAAMTRNVGSSLSLALKEAILNIQMIQCWK